MKEVSTALVAQGLVLLAVFIPTAFLDGITGQFFRQFALTIATATLISVFISLTLSPALAALIMRPKNQTEPGSAFGRAMAFAATPFRMFGEGFNWAFSHAASGYASLIAKLLKFSAVALAVYAGLLFLTYNRFNAAPDGFIPAQDQGYLITVIQLPPGSSLSRTDAVTRNVSDLIMKHPGVRSAVGHRRPRSGDPSPMPPTPRRSSCR